MHSSPVSDRIRHFIFKRFPLARTRGLENDDHLLENGILDSIGVLDLVCYLEEEFNIGVCDQDLTPDNFRSVTSVTAFIMAKRNGTEK